MLIKLVFFSLVLGFCKATLVIHWKSGDANVVVGSNVTVTEGDSFTLVCSDVSLENSDVIWSKVETLESKSNVVIQLPLKTVEPSVLEFTSVLLPDEGRYWCTDKVDEELTSVYVDVKPASVNNGQGVPVKIKSTFTSFQHGKEISDSGLTEQPELVIMQQTANGQRLAPSTIRAREGEEIDLMCVFKEVGGKINYEVTWSKLEKTENSVNTHKMYVQKSLNGVDPPKLVLKPFTSNDVGRYICSKSDTKLYQSVYIKIKPIKPNKMTPIATGVPQSLDCKSQNEQQIRTITEIREGLEAVCSMTRELLKKVNTPTVSA